MQSQKCLNASLSFLFVFGPCTNDDSLTIANRYEERKSTTPFYCPIRNTPKIKIPDPPVTYGPPCRHRESRQEKNPLSVGLLESGAGTLTTKLLGLAAAGVGDKEGTVVLNQSLLEQVLAVLVDVLCHQDR